MTVKYERRRSGVELTIGHQLSQPRRGNRRGFDTRVSRHTNCACGTRSMGIFPPFCSCDVPDIRCAPPHLTESADSLAIRTGVGCQHKRRHFLDPFATPPALSLFPVICYCRRRVCLFLCVVFVFSLFPMCLAVCSFVSSQLLWQQRSREERGEEKDHTHNT